MKNEKRTTSLEDCAAIVENEEKDAQSREGHSDRRESNAAAAAARGVHGA
jgi:hypothetical protein